jgi:hypothetical protein
MVKPHQVRHVSGWTFTWVVMIFFTAGFWALISHELPLSKSRIRRAVLFLAYGGLLVLTLFTFRLTLRVTTYSDFGFAFSIVLPSIIFWLSLSILAFGFLKTVVILVRRRTRVRTFGALRAFLPYQLCFIAIHAAYASAYSCPVGLALCAVVVALHFFEADVVAIRRGDREKGERAKWE